MTHEQEARSLLESGTVDGVQEAQVHAMLAGLEKMDRIDGRLGVVESYLVAMLNHWDVKVPEPPLAEPESDLSEN